MARVLTVLVASISPLKDLSQIPFHGPTHGRDFLSLKNSSPRSSCRSLLKDLSQIPFHGPTHGSAFLHLKNSSPRSSLLVSVGKFLSLFTALLIPYFHIIFRFPFSFLSEHTHLFIDWLEASSEYFCLLVLCFHLFHIPGVDVSIRFNMPLAIESRTPDWPSLDL